jgi:hypothetical protein
MMSMTTIQPHGDEDKGINWEYREEVGLPPGVSIGEPTTPQEQVTDVPLITERVITDQKAGLPTVQLTISWIFVLAFLYTLPWAIACTRRKSNCGAIGIINGLLGWTLVGWIIALVMACGPHAPVTIRRERIGS